MERPKNQYSVSSARNSGRLVEFDNPYALLDVPDSAFSKLYNASLAAEEEEDPIKDGDVTDVVKEEESRRNGT